MEDQALKWWQVRWGLAGRATSRLAIIVAPIVALIVAALNDVALLLLFALVLSFFALILFAWGFTLGQVLDKGGGKSPRASLVVAAVFAAVLYVVDAFVLLLEFFDFVLFGVVLLYFLPATLWALHRDRRVATLRAAKACIYLFAVVAIVVTIISQNRMADRRAVKLGDACLAYRAKYHHYPKDLEALVPEFIPSVPVPRYGLLFHQRFRYSTGPNGEDPTLQYALGEMPKKHSAMFIEYEIVCRCWRDWNGSSVYAHKGRY